MSAGQARISDPREIAERMARSLRSDLYAFIIDTRLVDYSVVKKLVGLAGLDQVLGKFARGNVVVYYIRRDLVLRRCSYEACADAPAESREACIADCFIDSIRRIADSAAKSILEAGQAVARETG